MVNDVTRKLGLMIMFVVSEWERAFKKSDGSWPRKRATKTRLKIAGRNSLNHNPQGSLT